MATARAGNIVGGGDWADHRIVPDCMHAAAAGTPLELRHPEAVRPWQHVLDAVAGYLQLGARLIDNPVPAARAWNFGPDAGDAATVGDLVEALLDRWTVRDGARPPGPTSPTAAMPHERSLLSLDSSAAQRSLGWNPRLALPDTVAWTVDWYWSSLRAAGADLRSLTIDQIEQYQRLEPDHASGARASASEVDEGDLVR